MKRFLILLLGALLLFSGCVNKGPEQEGNSPGAALTRFVRTEDGKGYTNALAGITYYPLDVGFEAAKTGGIAGNYVDEKFGYTMTFYEIPSLEAKEYLADHTLGIWYAGEKPVVASQLTVTDVLVCRDAAISVELFRFSAGAADAEIAEIRTLWFEAENAALPAGFPVSTFSVKLQFSELANIYYSFDICAYEDGSVYFRDVYKERLVAVPEDLAEKMIVTEE